MRYGLFRKWLIRKWGTGHGGRKQRAARRPARVRNRGGAAAGLALLAGAGLAAAATLLAGAGPAAASASSAAAPASPAAAIAAGNAHACTIQAGLAYCWGNNASGQLGNGTTVSSTGLADGTSYTVTVTVTTTTGTAASAPVTVQPAGFLSISVPSAATLPAAAPGGATTGQLGRVTVTDNRALGSASWTATVTGTAFTAGPGGAEKIPAGQVTYWSGPATASSGGGTFTPGQPTAAKAQTLSSSRVAFSLTGGSGVSSASWNPTLSVTVMPSVAAGTYTATITHSVT